MLFVLQELCEHHVFTAEIQNGLYSHPLLIYHGAVCDCLQGHVQKSFYERVMVAITCNCKLGKWFCPHGAGRVYKDINILSWACKELLHLALLCDVHLHQSM